MAHNDFENTVQGRFQGFESTPPEAVWSGINNLRNQRKKRIIILWWILPLATAACLGMGIYWETNYSSINLGSETLTIDLQILTNKSEKSIKTAIEITDARENESISTNSAKSNAIENTTPKSLEAGNNWRNSFSPTSENGTYKQRTSQPKSIDRSIDLRIATELDDNLTTIHTDQTDSKERLLLPSLTFLPLNTLFTSSPSLELSQAYGAWDYSEMREHSIGVGLGTFVNISGVSAKTQDATPLSLTDESASGPATYLRFLEIAPYYHFTRFASRWSFQVHALYGASSLTVTNSKALFSGRLQSIGLGGGTSYAIINKRFSLDAYAHLQSEIGFNRFTYNTNGWSSGSSGISTTNANDPNNGVPSSYHQFSLAAELGLRSSYILNRSNWAITANAGYRNYFWQQKVSSDAIIRTPSMLHLNVGIRYTFIRN